MPPDHHDHSGGHRHYDTGLYLKILLIGLAVIALEVIGSAVSGSLSLFSDALHATADTSAVGLALLIEFKVRNDHHSEARLRSIGGKVSSLILLITAAWIGFEAVERMFSPVEVRGKSMLLFAIVGTIGNMFCLFLMERNSKENITSTSLIRHIAVDLCQSFIVIFTAGAIILQPAVLASFLSVLGIYSLSFLDPLLSFGLSLVAGSLAIKTWKESSEIS